MPEIPSDSARIHETFRRSEGGRRSGRFEPHAALGFDIALNAYGLTEAHLCPNHLAKLDDLLIGIRRTTVSRLSPGFFGRTFEGSRVHNPAHHQIRKLSWYNLRVILRVRAWIGNANLSATFP